VVPAGWEDGEFVLNRNPKEFALVQDLFRRARFRHLKDEDVEQIIQERNRKWTMIRKSWGID
jgi:pyruvate ferredoxin oxidoreductase beta subunit